MLNITKPTRKHRIKALVEAAILATFFAFAAMSSYGILDTAKLFGICGFQQRHNLPCPFCGMTRSVCLFVRGEFIQAVKMQPAAAVMSLAAALYLLHCVLILCGIKIEPASKLARPIKPLPLLILTLLLLLIGWAVAIYGYIRLE